MIAENRKLLATFNENAQCRIKKSCRTVLKLGLDRRQKARHDLHVMKFVKNAKDCVKKMSMIFLCVVSQAFLAPMSI